MNADEEPPEERLLDEDAGPMVRPYVMTGGRLQPVRGKFDLITLVVATRDVPGVQPGLGPEHLAIVAHCQEPMSVAEIAAGLDLPAGTVRVLLGDLLDKGFVMTQEPQPEVDVRDQRMYEVVLDELRTL
ncbi:MAG TPA: DUF742 domain-containing protein [Streptosporangiaceae bacterium]|jgi:hypothetical protein